MGGLKSPTIIVLLSISHFNVVSNYFIYCGDPMWGTYIITIVMSSWIDPLITMQCPSLSHIIFFILRSVLSGMSIATPAFFWFPFAWTIFFHHLTFNLYVSQN